MTIRVYSTLTRRKEDLVPVVAGKISMYVCGPTVYKPSHVGHMVGPVIFDTIKRFLVRSGYDVKFVINITDIDDKLIVESARRGTSVPALAAEVTADYMTCLDCLDVNSVDSFPRATDHIPEILAMISGLIDKGHAYASDGDVYFDVGSDPDYGKLCNRDPDQLEAGARIEISSRKRNPGDFALWKGAKPSEPFWPSPWGNGRPGWHIECSAMSMKLLGESIDIHGGGLDLQFPHHENELAQSESFTGKPFAKLWLHNGLMKTGDRKMSKSEGNEIVVGLLLKNTELKHFVAFCFLRIIVVRLSIVKIAYWKFSADWMDFIDSSSALNELLANHFMVYQLVNLNWLIHILPLMALVLLNTWRMISTPGQLWVFCTIY